MSFQNTTSSEQSLMIVIKMIPADCSLRDTVHSDTLHFNISGNKQYLENI